MGLAMIIPYFLFDLYCKINYFGVLGCFLRLLFLCLFLLLLSSSLLLVFLFHSLSILSLFIFLMLIVWFLLISPLVWPWMIEKFTKHFLKLSLHIVCLLLLFPFLFLFFLMLSEVKPTESWLVAKGIVCALSITIKIKIGCIVFFICCGFFVNFYTLLLKMNQLIVKFSHPRRHINCPLLFSRDIINLVYIVYLKQMIIISR